jgi:CRISPR/Cas system CMR subunit Cmr6 (Cas7 group RAMP superfamily)
MNYGMKTKPREEETSMFELMQWNPQPSSNDFIKVERDQRVLKNKIQKTNTNWMSESHDNYRKFIYSPERQRKYFSMKINKFLI